MDHLPLPLGGRAVYGIDAEDPTRTQHLLIPYLEGAKYDGQGFDGALERMGSSLEHILESFRQEKPDRFVDSCLQQYLFFGFLHEFHTILGLTKFPKFHRYTQDGQKVLSTRPLLTHTAPAIWTEIVKPLVPHLVWRLQPRGLNDIQSSHWLIAQAQDFGHARLDPLRRRIYDLFQAVTAILAKINQCLFIPRTSTLMIRETRFKTCACLWILFEDIQALAHTLLTYSAHMDKAVKLPNSVGFTEIFMVMMRRQGWCPWVTSELFFPLHYYVALLPALDNRDHARCTTSACVANQVVDQAELRHLKTCDGKCSSLYADEDDIVHILENGDFPLIAGRSRRNPSKLTLVPCSKPAQDYVAISHVWWVIPLYRVDTVVLLTNSRTRSHGLGAYIANAIPLCQLNKLFRLARLVCGNVTALWLDTLCIPLSQKFTAYRAIAVNRMRETYSSAKAVVVLDRDLQQVGSSPLDRRIYLCCSDWMSRMWTLQEAILPGFQKVFIKFAAEQPVCLEQLLRACVQSKYTFLGIENQASYALARKFLRGPPSRCIWELEDIPEVAGLQRAEELFKAFVRRDSTKPDDEAVCLGILLDLASSNNAALFTMKDVYEGLSNVPASVLFTAAPRLQDRGYRALPRTFRRHIFASLSDWKSKSPSTTPYARLTPAGVEIKRPAFLIEGFELGIEGEGNFRGVLEPYDSPVKVLCKTFPWVDLGAIRGEKTAFIPNLSAVDLHKHDRQAAGCVILTEVQKINEVTWSGVYLTVGILQFSEDWLDQRSYGQDTLCPYFAAELTDDTTWLID